MKLKTFLCAVVAVPLLLGGTANAVPFGQNSPSAQTGGIGGLLPPNWLGRSGDAATVQLAQAGDPRIPTLEEQVRDLTGRVEELNFLLLQMEDQMRKMQEDNEFRLQQLEEKRGDAGAATGNRVTAAEPAAPVAPPASSTAPSTAQEGPVRGEPPRTLGTVTFDANGNPTGGTLDTNGQMAGSAAPMMDDGGAGTDNTQVAALPPTDDPEELYRNAYNFILSGDYPTAEAGFREHIERFPGDPKTADARYWLGEALLGMEQYRSAAETFLAANREFPDAPKAPDMLLKLGVSLAALQQRDVACATYSEIGKRYKDVSSALKERVRAEQALAGC
ncbi:tol-pal system protein YbgF [Aquibium carbonis]|uniref:Cell division coordinator CpoB n=1 Tax=Aquibium carbonis TaxID=2495581 RepID=A0A3R9ZQ15_9HYPH|nr:tol-pal system protein YbgF [Aquibium carbonis]RST84948.1 tol-pal system protein YbgF [Aquibium carbonis]